MVHSSSAAARRCRTPCAARVLLPAVLSIAALTAQAQPAAKTSRADPLDPNAGVPTLVYRSSLAQYRRLGDDKPTSWRDANDTVTRIGGWRAYAREAQQPEPAPAAKPVTLPAPAGHSGHKSP